MAADLSPADLVPVTDEVISYVVRYGGMCRDCELADGICSTGLPCDNPSKTVRWVLEAINYGVRHGYLTADDAAPMGEGNQGFTVSRDHDPTTGSALDEGKT